jgi:hypothetical protein
MPLKFTAEDTPFDHLHPDVVHLATADRATRKAAILTDRWIGYPAADDAIERMFEQIDTPPRLRMGSILFWAPPNSGKSHIISRFLALHAVRPGQKDIGVLSLEVNDGLNEKRFYIDLLTTLGAPAPDTTASRLQAMVIRQLRARRIRLLILDEIQRITELRERDQRLILNVLKYLSNQLSMSIAGFGSGEAKALIESDPHLEERFDIVALPIWKGQEKWVVQVVKDRLSFIPLRKPTTVDRALMRVLFTNSGALPGRLFSLIERSAIVALENEEYLTSELVEAVAQRRRRAMDG